MGLADRLPLSTWRAWCVGAFVGACVRISCAPLGITAALARLLVGGNLSTTTVRLAKGCGLCGASTTTGMKTDGLSSDAVEPE